MHYLDLLMNAGWVDFSTWARVDVWTSASEQELAREVSRKSGGSAMSLGAIVGGLCCLLVVIGVIALIIMLVIRANNATPPPRPPYNPHQYPPHGGQYPPGHY
ncbi:hypothetical protein [Nocardia cyriacigeorgica]|uniref:hypothetical protein n=1 Tax=Nocardia cyriacigeorgica TaxID=135487 RepID=UPI001109B0FC|nr:hypothetical protein [Nocardia cyriacigeorgica]TLF56250.1 hypothetical protein FEK31_16710 [Nocardia cyriacigeorgica]